MPLPVRRIIAITSGLSTVGAAVGAMLGIGVLQLARRGSVLIDSLDRQR